MGPLGKMLGVRVVLVMLALLRSGAAMLSSRRVT